MNTPLVTVLMAVHNGVPYLRTAIDSILRQTYPNFEFIIIDDASTDTSSWQIASCRDSRIRLFSNIHKLRLAGSLNRGLQSARGKYIARMDADDICHPARLAKQVAFMEEHPDIGVCGTWLVCFGEKNQLWDYAVDPEIILCNLLFQNQLAHATVMMRREWMLDNSLYYNPEFIESEDYELWARFSEHFALANLPEVLYMYRWHQKQASQARMDEQYGYARLVALRQLKKIGLRPSEEELKIHLMFSTGINYTSYGFINGARLWLQKIYQANLRRSYYPQSVFTKVLEQRWKKICHKAGLSYSPLISFAGMNSSRY
ncbi:MAG: glycosyltransferase family 2 protein [Syntrophomonas sp.]